MSLPSHHSPNSSFESVMAELPSVACSAFSLPHQPVPAGTLAFSRGLTPLLVGLTVACSGSFFSSCPLVTLHHHRERNTDHYISSAKKSTKRHICWFLSLEFKVFVFVFLSFHLKSWEAQLGRRSQYSYSCESLQMFGLCQHSCFPATIDNQG